MGERNTVTPCRQRQCHEYRHAGEASVGAGCSEVVLEATGLKGQPGIRSLLGRLKYRPDYPRRPFASKEEGCQWVASFVDT